MPALYLLIKPSSSGCNMRCKYCFYADVAKNRECPSYGMMTEEVLETLVKRAFEFASGECTFAFQGGEPTLAGLDFYRKLIGFVNIYNKKKIPVHYSLQTNGFLIDEEWAEFFAEHKFLIGVSLDGDEKQHDLFRRTVQGKGSFEKVIKGIGFLRKKQVDFSVLTVVTAPLCDRVDEVYDFFQANDFMYQQYIPCIDEFGGKEGETDYSLTSEKYGAFLIRLFDRWYEDLQKQKAPSIRYFDNLYLMLKNQMPESCGMSGTCSVQNVVEADGSVYPCDFYVLDEYALGNIRDTDFEGIYRRRKKIRFIEQSFVTNQECMSCPHFMICRGGCRRHREEYPGSELGKNRFCEAYKMFFDHAYEKLARLAEM